MALPACIAEAIARAPRVVAHIHHAHGLKAAIGLHRLARRFTHWDNDFWQRALTQAGWPSEPVTDLRPLDDAALAASYPDRFTARRARIMVERGVLPLAYLALRDWVQAEGMDAVVDHYANDAAQDPGYLGHRVTILLAFREAWPLYRDAAERDRAIERLAEFLFACRHPPVAATASPPATSEAALAASLRHPGYFGHHLLTFVWVNRHAHWLGPARSAAIHGAVVQACATVYADAEDNVEVRPEHLASVAPVPTDADLEDTLQTLLTTGPSNIHLITLADAAAWLWDGLAAERRRELLAALRCLGMDRVD